ncbi:hypothetical protein HY214_00125 [Candidatus Roizmanbacteria bacterium]|nr:hypothetical protein [Candidatus Roizmanbacteria bacterium]
MTTTHTSTRTRVMYSCPVEKAAVNQILEKPFGSLGLASDVRNNYVYNLSELVGVARGIYNFGNQQGFYNEANGFINNAGITITHFPKFDSADSGEEKPILTASIAEVFRVTTNEQLGLSIKQQIELLQSNLDKHGIAIPLEDMFAIGVTTY